MQPPSDLEPAVPLLSKAGRASMMLDIMEAADQLAAAAHTPNLPQATIAVSVTQDGAQVIAAYNRKLLGGTMSAGGRVTFTKVGRVTPEGFVVWTRDAE